ncbi:MraY family glycosyltransferase [Ramlibacter humi]|uniref:Glycosyl transferase n=1 Tax=Ramlibacter humi TaxID=2530451 RepID=A0A4Z0C0S4_9BURK|nr:glycosyltransferase [Ramlibacter humi]TFZ03839.1 glycosyl transferase [Ramlibacter humi]
MFAFIVALLISVITTTVVLRYNHVHERWSSDHSEGVQKFHKDSIPRIGGLGLGVALVGVSLVQGVLGDPYSQPFVLLLLCASPAFLGGLAEDLTKKVGVLPRLFLTMLAAVLGFFVLDAQLTSVDVGFIDRALRWWPLALLVTAIAVGGVANAINIIDGYNGLSGVVSCVILAGLGYIAFQIGDILVFRACLAMIGAIIGFLFWNWPWGRIFLGDGGAYLIGFWIGELSLLLLARNPQVSPWFPLLLVAYPVVETLFSIYRRMVVRRGHPGLPDAVHLHQLIFRRLVRWSVGSEQARHLTVRNSMTAPYLWLISSLSVFPAVLLWRSTFWLQVVFVCFAALYVWFYASLVRFKSMKWWITRRH